MDEAPAGQPIVFHQPSPYLDGDFEPWSPPLEQSQLYHGDAEKHVPLPFTVNTPGSDKRATALDALRGLFLLSMTFGFAIASDHLPIWMYHRQLPPPGDTPVNIAGISWRDVTYGAFLFSMAAAVPIVLGRRIARGAPELAIIGGALRRGFMLFVFALMIGHSNTFFIGYTNTGRVIAIVGFLITFAMFTRPPKNWDPDRVAMIQRLGWVAAIAFLALSPLVYHQHFTFSRIDDIISELAFASTTVWIIWYFTRNHVPVRLAILGVIVALFLAAQHDGAVQRFWFSSPMPWLWQNSSLVVMCVVIPGTIAGDAVLRWMRSPEPEVTDTDRSGWSLGRMTALLLLATIVTPILVVGMYNRWLVATTAVLFVLGGIGIALSWRTSSPAERLIRDLFIWGTVWLMIGMAVEPLYGGIRKIPDNISYYFSMAGASTMMLAAMTIVTDLFKAPKTVRLLTDVGQNPMLCYILFTAFLNSVFELIPPMRNFLMGSPGISLVRTALTVALVAWITREFSRRRIFWRA